MVCLLWYVVYCVMVGLLTCNSVAIFCWFFVFGFELLICFVC